MLPIDEHAKSGAEVWVLSADRALKVTWEDDVGGWLTPDGSFVPERWARGYLPASWVENAWKMREALHGLYFASTRKSCDAALNVLSATEWPEVKG